MSITHSKIGLGTVQFGIDYGISNLKGKTPLHEVEKIIEYAEVSGIRYFDTAYAYGDAEKVLGHFDLRPYRIVSKYIPGKVSLCEQFETSLQRLRATSLYAYLAHRPTDLIVKEKENWKILSGFRDVGKVKKIGASFDRVEELQQVLDAGINLDIVQVPFNYFDNRFERYIKDLHNKGVEVHTRSAFLQGLFFCNVDELSVFFDEVKQQIRDLQKYEGLSSRLLKFILEKPFIDVVNIGVNNLMQLRENIESLAVETEALPLPNKSIDNRILIPSEWPR